MKMFRLDATYAHGSIKKTFAFFNWNQDFHPHMHHNECYIFFCSFLFCTVSVWPNFPFTFSLAIVPVYSTNDFPRTVLQCVSISLAKTHTHTHTCMQTSSHSTTTTGAAVKYWGRGEELDPRQYKPRFTVRRFRSDLQCEKRSHLNIC